VVHDIVLEPEIVKRSINVDKKKIIQCSTKIRNGLDLNIFDSSKITVLIGDEIIFQLNNTLFLK